MKLPRVILDFVADLVDIKVNKICFPWIVAVDVVGIKSYQRVVFGFLQLT